MGKMVEAVQTLYDELYTTRQVQKTSLLKSGTRAADHPGHGRRPCPSTEEGSRLSLF